MKLSTRSRYGLRAMLDLAERFGDGPLMMNSMARNQELSPKYLHALLITLKSAGLIRSFRGAKGGYTLTRPPSKIKVSEVIHRLEGSLSIVDCVQDKTLCKRSDLCVTREVWDDLSKAFENVLENLTLEDLVLRKREKESAAQMYHI